MKQIVLNRINAIAPNENNLTHTHVLTIQQTGMVFLNHLALPLIYNEKSNQWTIYSQANMDRTRPTFSSSNLLDVIVSARKNGMFEDYLPEVIQCLMTLENHVTYDAVDDIFKN